MKRIFLMFFVCFVMISIAGCGSDADRNAIYDDDAKIAKTADSHFSQLSVYNRENNKYNMSAQAFTGAKTVWSYTAKNEGDVTFSYLLSVSKGGKAKLVLITPNNEVIILSENADNTTTDEMQSQTISLKKGKNRIKIVGYENPALNLILSVDVGQLVDE